MIDKETIKAASRNAVSILENAGNVSSEDIAAVMYELQNIRDAHITKELTIENYKQSAVLKEYSLGWGIRYNGDKFEAFPRSYSDAMFSFYSKHDAEKFCNSINRHVWLLAFSIQRNSEVESGLQTYELMIYQNGEPFIRSQLSGSEVHTGIYFNSEQDAEAAKYSKIFQGEDNG